MQTSELYELFFQNPFVSTDTRTIMPGSLFFCLRGEKFNGNTFAQEAMRAGASRVVIDDTDFREIPGAILVENVLESLQQLALFHRNTLTIPVIGITGTNGKTTTKELITATLATKYRVTATAGNLNNHIGVPLTLLSVKQEDDIAIIEMGAGGPGEIAMLCELAQPGCGIITNVGKAHLQGFGNIETILETKTALYRKVIASGGLLFVNADDPTLLEHAKPAKHLTYGSSAGAHCRGRIISADPFLEIAWGENESHSLQTKLTGAYNFNNVMAAICIGQHFGLGAGEINAALSAYRPANMRSQYLETPDNKIILDAYNANPDSMRQSLQSFSAIKADKKALILGDMLELGDAATREHADIVECIESLEFPEVFLIGPVFSAVAGGRHHCFENTEEARAFIKSAPLQKSFILVKGSRGMELEKLLDVL
jgi:UDP-N-acetylmuramoyl-tripeptide--D-alanyl-D-alanine ligase